MLDAVQVCNGKSLHYVIRTCLITSAVKPLGEHNWRLENEKLGS